MSMSNHVSIVEHGDSLGLVRCGGACGAFAGGRVQDRGSAASYQMRFDTAYRCLAHELCCFSEGARTKDKV